MKPEVYRCLKTLEAYKVGLMNMWANGYSDSAYFLQKQYSSVCEELKKYLSQEEFAMIQIVESVNLSNVMYKHEAELKMVNRLVVAVEMTLAYLRSLDMDLGREVTKKELELKKSEIELKKREDELKIREGEVESMKKIYSELVNIKRGLPELIRSEVTRGIKKSHRGIEENTNSNTKSQNN